MPLDAPVTLWLLRCKQCGSLFTICRRCYRGHRYCGKLCREKARRQQQKDANRRYRQSREAREDHRDRQQRYRRKNFVLHHGSKAHPTDAMIRSAKSSEAVATMAAAPGPEYQVNPVIHGSVWGTVRCQICGRFGRLTDIPRY
jgi:hypothetical protein